MEHENRAMTNYGKHVSHRETKVIFFLTVISFQQREHCISNNSGQPGMMASGNKFGLLSSNLN